VTGERRPLAFWVDQKAVTAFDHCRDCLTGVAARESEGSDEDAGVDDDPHSSRYLASALSVRMPRSFAFSTSGLAGSAARPAAAAGD
jgi:hypothetical protein